MAIGENGKKPIVKKNIDISKVSIPEVRFNLKEKDFVEWCAKHGYTGKVLELWKSKQKVEKPATK